MSIEYTIIMQAHCIESVYLLMLNSKCNKADFIEFFSMFLAAPLSRLEQSFVEFLRSLPENNAFKEWNIVAFNLDKVSL